MFKNLMAPKPKNEAKKIDSAAKAEYLNVPIQLLAGFMDDTRTTIRNIYYYSLYTHFIRQEKGTEKEKYRLTCDWLNFQEVDREENLQRGKILFDRFPNSPMTGIDRNLYSEFNKLDKTDFDKACFLAYHAFKSIVGNKTFQKADNKFLWARMDGRVKSIKDVSELSEKVRFFSQEYQTLKIKRELQENWSLVYYAQQTRGFYVSFKLDLKALIMEAMKRKRQSVEKERLSKVRSLEKEVLEKLEKQASKLTHIKSAD